MTTLAIDERGNPIQVTPQGVVQNLVIGAAHQRSAAFGGSTRVITLATDADCYYLISAAGTIVTSTTGSFLPSGSIYSRAVKAGWFIDVIQKSGSSGTLNITEDGDL